MRMLAAFVILGASMAQAQDSVEEAEALYREGALPDALRSFQAALEAGGHEPDTLASVYWHLGVLSTITGAEAEAARSFERALSLDPNLRTPDELPPEAQDRYRALQRQARRLELRLQPGEVSSTQETSIALSIRNAPDGLARTVRASAAPEGAPPWRSEASAGEERIGIEPAAWRGSDRLQVEVQVVDAHGNILARATTTLRATSEAAPVVPTNERSVAASPWLWTSVAVVVLGAVLAAVLLSRRDDRFQGGDISIERR
ncbi:MAG: hypothetical protein AAGE52_33015 [Myxococcota bacterium]